MSKNSPVKIKRALISVSDKKNILVLAKSLQKESVEIISTGGTLKFLVEAGIEVKNISEFTGSKEMMNGRVKTLHPKVHAGILSRRNIDKNEVKKNSIEEIDLVVVNLYPFEETVKNNGTFEEAIENIDIGGPTMIRASAKNFYYVSVHSSPNEYESFIKEFEKNKAISYATRLKLAETAFSNVTKYDLSISDFFENFDKKDLPKSIFGTYYKSDNLRYGENPHQKAAFYKLSNESTNGISSATQLQGKELSYNNIADTDAALECVSNFSEASCVIVKHANPCGVASSKSVLEAYKSMGRHYSQSKEVKDRFQSSSFKRSILVCKKIQSGDILSKKNIRIARPSHGMCPSKWTDVLGKKVKRNLEIGDPLVLRDLEV